jgi:hypothetical protein
MSAISSKAQSWVSSSAALMASLNFVSALYQKSKDQIH